jgi:hypothetical protein
MEKTVGFIHLNINLSVVICMGTVPGKYINGSFCSFLRISPAGDQPYYLITIDISYTRTIRCRLKKSDEGVWQLQDTLFESFVANNLPCIVEIIERNEALLFANSLSVASSGAVVTS